MFTMLFRALTRGLLSPTRASLRVAELERSRTGTVDDADARLRSIERDLHDGTQARLVAVAMQLGKAREHLADGGDVDPGRRARRHRPLLHQGGPHGAARAGPGHPPARARQRPHRRARDPGRAVGRCRSTWTSTRGGGGRPPGAGPGVDRLLHRRRARDQRSQARPRHRGVVLVVPLGAARRRPDPRARRRPRRRERRDRTDGSGLRSGLAGLAERVRSVDGTFDLSSPAGGPTVVTVILPTTSPAAVHDRDSNPPVPDQLCGRPAGVGACVCFSRRTRRSCATASPPS